MSKEGVDLGRRRFLTATATVVGGAGVVLAAVPFVSYMNPSARARAAGAPVEADIAKIEPGQKVTYKWRGQPVWIVRRTDEMLAGLEDLTGSGVLADPHSENTEQQPPYCQNEVRSIEPRLLVAIGICTHLGCSPTYRPEVAPADLGAEWKGGFFCPCHGSRFDLAGRVYQGVPAQDNLKIPPHRYLSDTLILIGEDKGAA
ncbi:MAG: ubiquinol-cytochrome c reductase iron-sulfur subunit [Gammaproteobacteria bacterium]|nr:ubiquinol-cytochrome c reductase iron-sulfur subunit [Gammaproteobacteria bacterium]NIR98299.1 ubiquinol-cytochrome c reductase iron-sulfur subunit [Gammaproteobacteria bacterium]NIT64046.1 ubiquinol-cytochrome c reductase iron-sulfur subunit [Gammaproteobacteria bacterium]NIV20977.1 ubiquinol-cytochrome c reductase iron-sulfur subunit [Gammaproteobacteria bacterium]NIX10374.1 ubiquinol-cytochrome c reductase iron-sulfur subunit [Gammaproteobacteria bacterium]